MTLSEESERRLLSYDWPGNVRELANCLERAVILCDGWELTPELLGFGTEGATPPPTGLDLSGSLADVSRRAAAMAEKEKIRQVLADVAGDRAKAAEELQVSGKTLLAKMREYGLTEEKGGGRDGR
jgi:DNA-binding NtrC family response regulator